MREPDDDAALPDDGADVIEPRMQAEPERQPQAASTQAAVAGTAGLLAIFGLVQADLDGVFHRETTSCFA